MNRRRHLRALLLFLMLLPLAVGCVRVHTSLTISPDDRVSGQIVAAAKAKNPIAFLDMKDMMISMSNGGQQDRPPVMKIKVVLEIADAKAADPAAE